MTETFEHFDPNLWDEFVKARPNEVKGATLSLEGLKAGTYRVQWWDTWAGKVKQREGASVKEGRLQLAPPFLTDLACQIERTDQSPEPVR